MSSVSCLPFKISDRILLKASLEHILSRQDVEEHVKDATEVLRRFANAADHTQEFRRKRADGR